MSLKKDGIMAMKSQDKKPVTIMSTCHRKFKRVNNKLVIVIYYNQCM